LRLDGDMYGSTWVVLENLYEKLSADGYVVIDDFALDHCREAVLDFRKLKNINEPINRTDYTEVYWKKV